MENNSLKNFPKTNFLSPDKCSAASESFYLKITLKLSLLCCLVLAVLMLFELILQFWELFPVFFIKSEDLIIVFSILCILICWAITSLTWIKPILSSVLIVLFASHFQCMTFLLHLVLVTRSLLFTLLVSFLSMASSSLALQKWQDSLRSILHS